MDDLIEAGCLVACVDDKESEGLLTIGKVYEVTETYMHGMGLYLDSDNIAWNSVRFKRLTVSLNKPKLRIVEKVG